MDNFSFELFDGQGGRYNINVSISKPGLLSFTFGAYRKYNIARYAGADLLFDKKNRVIAIRFHEICEENMFKVKPREEGKGGSIACKSFLTAYELEEFFGKRFVPTEIEDDAFGKLLIIDLNKPVQ